MTEQAALQGRKEGLERFSTRTNGLLLFGIVLVVSVMLILSAELAVRVRQVVKYGSSQTIEQLYTTDPELNLRVPVANLVAGPIRTNSMGFRGPEIAVEKSPGTVRIAFLGASTTWCAEVSSNADAWPHLVSESLAREFPGRRFEYVNAGVPGYTVSASLNRLEHRVAELKPDIIVIYHATNDMSGELRDLASARGLLRSSMLAAPSAFLADYSLLWNLAQKNLAIIGAQRAVRANHERLAPDDLTLGQSFGRALRSLIAESKRHARFVAVATFSTRLRAGQTMDRQLEAAASALYYMPFMTPGSLLESYAAYNRQIESAANDAGVMLVAGHDDIPGDAAHFVDSVHFSDLGSRVMSRRVFKALSGPVDIRDWLKSGT